MIKVRGDGLFRFDGVDHHLHWIAELTRTELVQYLEGGYSRAVDEAPWRLNDGREIDHTYLRLDLSMPKTSLSSVGVVRVEHESRGWIAARDFLLGTLSSEEGAPEVTGLRSL